ncbi:uncharacterized protein HD556DRAFT_1330797 [Suillus plorans]|uniref:Uncharacterized protein n=1 Tax=Suillus plorans TaxID=116603 RepID=A0A9P7DV94_9AGAM|nr:uncharacterized protein HD556DRAFT_1330797 [Suillus plorans]KAG1803880.1 hypothetical protein HD556DRAFT_1330797 [Suillus plorans]
MQKNRLLPGTRSKGRLQPKNACPMKQQIAQLSMGHAECAETDLQAHDNTYEASINSGRMSFLQQLEGRAQQTASESNCLRERARACHIVHRQLKPPLHDLDKKSGRIHDAEGVHIVRRRARVVQVVSTRSVYIMRERFISYCFKLLSLLLIVRNTNTIGQRKLGRAPPGSCLSSRARITR